MKNLTCCFTGHRIIEKTDINELEKNLSIEIEKLIKRGIIYFNCGGAIGFDTIAAEAVLRLREIYDNIRLILVLPCRNQDGRWSEENKERYRKIKENADRIIYTSDSYTRNCMQIRNKHLVDHSSVCVAYIRRRRGGTAYTVKYAGESGVEIIVV